MCLNLSALWFVFLAVASNLVVVFFFVAFLWALRVLSHPFQWFHTTNCEHWHGLAQGVIESLVGICGVWKISLTVENVTLLSVHITCVCVRARACGAALHHWLSYHSPTWKVHCVTFLGHSCSVEPKELKNYTAQWLVICKHSSRCHQNQRAASFLSVSLCFVTLVHSCPIGVIFFYLLKVIIHQW